MKQKEETSLPEPPSADPAIAIDQLRAAGLHDQQIARLLRMKEQHAAGAVSELTREHKYLEFAKFLVDSRTLHD